MQHQTQQCTLTWCASNQLNRILHAWLKNLYAFHCSDIPNMLLHLKWLTRQICNRTTRPCLCFSLPQWSVRLSAKIPRWTSRPSFTELLHVFSLNFSTFPRWTSKSYSLLQSSLRTNILSNLPASSPLHILQCQHFGISYATCIEPV